MAENCAQSVLPVHDRILKLSMALLLVGIWLVAAPFVLRYYWHPTATPNDIIAGLLTITLAITTTIKPHCFRTVNWMGSYLGFWLGIAPFVLGYLSYDFPDAGGVPMWNDLICGVIVWFLFYVKALCQSSESDLA